MFLSFGDNVLIRTGQMIDSMSKLRPTVGKRTTSATPAGNTPKIVSCQRT